MKSSNCRHLTSLLSACAIFIPFYSFVCLCVCVSIFLYLFLFISTSHCVCQSQCLGSFKSTCCLSVCLSFLNLKGFNISIISLGIFSTFTLSPTTQSVSVVPLPFVYLFICLFVCLSFLSCPSVSLLFSCPYVCLSVFLSVSCPSVCLSVCLSVTNFDNLSTKKG